jgi:hypothetical protein
MLDHLDDIASDMSAFHRIDDVTRLSGPAFFKLAWRLPAYAGVMQSRAVAASREESSPTAPPASGSYSPGRQQINPGTKASLQADPAFQGIFSFG